MAMGKLDTRTAGADADKTSRRRASAPGSCGARLPLEWMDGSAWRLPSGKALAEFALQAGFLAPLMLEKPRWRSKGADSGKGK